MNQFYRALQMPPRRLLRKLLGEKEVYTIAVRPRPTAEGTEPLPALDGGAYTPLPGREGWWFADPLLYRRGGRRWLFAEAMDLSTGKGRIEVCELALWNVGAEREVIRGCDATRFTELRALEPYYHARPWSAALAGKRVLVVHPFRKTILSQYEKRAQLFPGRDILPEFASLTVIQAVQGLAGQDTGYDSWFDALDAMQARMDAADYDVAIIGAGAYGLPLAAHARDTGHAAIQMSGATQLLFGIKGRRWDDHPVISKLYNPAWVRPDESEGITHKEKVEGGSYW